MTPSRAAVLMLGAIAAAGCAAEAHDGGFTLTDSAGVELAVNSGALEPTTWALSAEPLTVIGDEARGDTPLFRVWEVRLGSDGRVVVGHGGGNEVRTYAADGRPLWVAGRAGQGPGEFLHVTQLTLLAADSVVVLDTRNQRLTLIDPEGAFVGSTTLTYRQPQPPENAVWIPSIVLMGATSRHEAFAILRMTALLEGAPGPRVLRGALTLFDPSGAAGDSLRAVPVSVMWETPGGAFAVESTAFSVVFRPFVANDLLYAATSDAWEVSVFDRSGTRLRSIREVRPRLALTSEAIDAVPDPPAGMERPTHFPDSIPAIGRVVADREGRIWAVARQPSDSDPTSARIYDAEGRLVGTLPLPGGFQLMDVRGDRLVGVQKDVMDVETVVLYRFTAGPT